MHAFELMSFLSFLDFRVFSIFHRPPKISSVGSLYFPPRCRNKFPKLYKSVIKLSQHFPLAIILFRTWDNEQFDLDEGRLQSFSSHESQETKEIDLFMSLLHNWKTTKVNGTDSKLYILSFSDNSTSYSVGISMGVSGSVEHHSSCREEETYMDSKVDEFESAGVARSLMIVSKSSGFANFLMEQVCSDGVDCDSLVYKSPEDFSLVSRDYPVENSKEESEVSRGLGADVDDCDGDFELVDVIVVQALCGLSNIKKIRNLLLSSFVQIMEL